MIRKGDRITRTGGVGMSQVRRDQRMGVGVAYGLQGVGSKPSETDGAHELALDPRGRLNHFRIGHFRLVADAPPSKAGMAESGDRQGRDNRNLLLDDVGGSGFIGVAATPIS